MRKCLGAALGALMLVLVPSALAAAPAPVPSLTPTATHALWLKEVSRATLPSLPHFSADAACRPTRAIFYAQSDWLRLATRLAQTPSACAQYYVSVPPLAADKTQPRSGQASQIRALGSSFHALDEISYSGWSTWVAAGSGTWYDAGVLARQRMDAAGYSPAAGDTWALNELSSAVRKGTGSARQNARDFIRGLGNDGVKGVVFVSGIGQTTGDLGTYKVNMQGWLQDAAFWNDVAPYVSDWQQENYGDVRAYAATGTTPQQRRDALVQYLGHPLALANAGPDTAAAARAVLGSSYGSLSNGAWAWGSAYGWTSVPVATMEDFVSAQVYASRALSAGAPLDRLGFAWAPSNTLGLASGDYTAQTAAVLDRIAAAIRDSGTPTPDPGAAACAPTWCTATLDGAALSSAWQTFSSWSSSSLVFSTPPATLVAGAATGPVTVQLQTAGVPDVAPTDQVVTFSSSSPKGTFSASATGPWSPSLGVAIPAGGSSATVYYSDTAAGAPTVSAALNGQAPATQSETVAPAAASRLLVSPSAASVGAGKTLGLRSSAVDAYGNSVPVTPAWSVGTTAYGRLTSAAGSTTTFVAGTRAGKATVTATLGGLSSTAAVTVLEPVAPRLASIAAKKLAGHATVTATVLAGGRPAAHAAVRLRVRRGAHLVVAIRGRTNAQGKLSWRSPKRLPRGHYVASAALLSAPTISRTQQFAM